MAESEDVAHDGEVVHAVKSPESVSCTVEQLIRKRSSRLELEVVGCVDSDGGGC